jgi:hypothetical protein
MSEKMTLTTTAGAPIGDNQNSITTGRHGPVLIQDYQPHLAKAGGSDMTYAERAAKRARAIYEAALFSTLMQQESATASELGDEFDFDVTLRETLVRMVSKELQKGGE